MATATSATLDLTLRAYLKTIYFPAKQFGKQDRERQRYITLHNRFRLQLGRDPLLSDFAPGMFDSFREWMRPRWSEATFDTTAAAWRRIVDHMQGLG